MVNLNCHIGKIKSHVGDGPLNIFVGDYLD